MRNKSSISNEKDNQELLDELNRAYLGRWHSGASFVLGCLAGSVSTLFIWALWELIKTHGR